MNAREPIFDCRLAEGEADLRAAQRLRYDVFVAELGGDGPMVDHAARLERDRFDAFCRHLLLVDRAADDRVVAVYRLLDAEGAARAGGFYTSGEYDLAPLVSSGRRLLELGRSCLHADYRGGAAMFHLWTALALLVQEWEIDVLFGVASFHGTDVPALAQPLSHLHHHHLAPEPIRVRALPSSFQRMDLMPREAIDRKAAMVATPALIKAYLRLGGFVGEGAFVDRVFNTTDVCLVLDTARMNLRQRDLYAGRTA
jgi:L-ornithine Nalpha-acyltransferase